MQEKKKRVLNEEQKRLNVQRVINWRKRTKQRMVDSMGGCCQICGYKKCNDALDFHHIDPTQKEFAFGKIRSSIQGWNTIVKELRKCILLCKNCHHEVHDGITELPTTYAHFDESYVDYKSQRTIVS